MSYLARPAGVVEGVDVLGAEVHHPAVDSVEIRASGGVAGVAAPRWRLGWVPGCRRPQEPRQRAEQREPRAASHGGRRAPQPGRARWRRGERSAASSKAPCRPRRRRSAAQRRAGDAWQAPPASAGDALEKGRSNIDAAAGGLHGKSLAGGRGGERYRGWGLLLCSPTSKIVSFSLAHI